MCLFLLGSKVESINVARRGDVRRAKLYYLRDRVGKSTRVREFVGDKARKERDSERGRRDAFAAASAEVEAPASTDETEEA